MNKTFRVHKTSDFAKLAKDIHYYRRTELPYKYAEFGSRLADLGIQIARVHTNTYGGFIIFSKDIGVSNEKGNTTLLVACKTQDIIQSWYQKEKDANGQHVIKSEPIDPLLMEEFGSGSKAVPTPFLISGVGQGTYPVGGHGNEGSWWYKPSVDENGMEIPYESSNWVHSYGYKPGMPMYHAALEMHGSIVRIAQEVFKT